MSSFGSPIMISAYQIIVRGIDELTSPSVSEGCFSVCFQKLSQCRGLSHQHRKVPKLAVTIPNTLRCDMCYLSSVSFIHPILGLGFGKWRAQAKSVMPLFLN